VVLLELYEHGAVEELDVFVVELRERGACRCAGGRSDKRVRVAKNGGAGSEGSAAFEETSSGWLRHYGVLFLARSNECEG